LEDIHTTKYDQIKHKDFRQSCHNTWVTK